MSEASARIPKNFAPEKYSITFSPDYSNLKYTMETEQIVIWQNELWLKQPHEQKGD